MHTGRESGLYMLKSNMIYLRSSNEYCMHYCGRRESGYYSPRGIPYIDYKTPSKERVIQLYSRLETLKQAGSVWDTNLKTKGEY